MIPRKRWWPRVVLVTLVLLAAGYVASLLALRPGRVDCPASKGALLVVDTARHTLALCEAGEGGAPSSSFRVRLGKQGTGKSREGDGKTPLGRYGLGAPRASGSFGTFVPMAYPTQAQRSEGFTGGAVGVHGPDRRVRWLGALVNAIDTTDGCVGVATDREMDLIAKWVRDRRAKEIVIE
jgi:murein L,D-transpeptidase YafK